MRVMKTFRFKKRIPATLIEYYEVKAETEEEALEMVMNGEGFEESFTRAECVSIDAELYDVEDTNPESVICPGCSQTWCECE